MIMKKLRPAKIYAGIARKNAQTLKIGLASFASLHLTMYLPV